MITGSIAGLIVFVLFAVLLLALWLVLRGGQEQKKNALLENQVNELRRDIQTMATAQAQNSGQIASIGQSVTQRLESVTKALSEGVKDSAQIAAQSQAAMATELKNSRDTLTEIQKQLGAVQQAGSQMSQTAQTLQNILGGAKSRGTLGEVTLERLLGDALPNDRYKRQYGFSSGEEVDCVIFLRDRLLPIDSKFPLDAYRRIADEGDDARKAFATAVKGHADTIAKKYILPNEGTLGIALMFVPSESVYYELLMTADAKKQPLDEYCRSKNVIAVSPNTLYAHLQVILMGLQGMQIEENAKRLHASLAGLEKQVNNFGEVFWKLGTHLKNAQQSFNDADKKLEKAQNTLDGLLAGVASESPAAVSEGQGSLTLLPETEPGKSS